MAIAPRWEWRTFGDSFGQAERRFASLSPERVQDSDDLYLLSRCSDASVKVRDGLMDVKQLQSVNDDGLEQWKPVLKASFPLSAADLQLVLDTVGVDVAPPEGAGSLDEFVEALAGASPGLMAVMVHKHRKHYTVAGAMAEVTTRARRARSRSSSRTLLASSRPSLSLAWLRATT
jgi:exopolyphosphatase/guanosine-5'-triphosphate,3'-diphosphate pyrophosphatase